MDIEKLIEHLRECGTYGFKQEECRDAATALSTLQTENAQLRAYLEYEREHADAYYEECGQWEAENEKLRAELERVKKKNKYSAHDVALILSDAFGDSCACNFNGNDEWLPEKCELLDTCPDVVGVACWEQYLKKRRTDMERLTEKRYGQNVIPLRQNGKVKWSICSAGLGDAPTEYLYGEHADRLAAYEDTGLEPEEIQAISWTGF